MNDEHPERDQAATESAGGTAPDTPVDDLETSVDSTAAGSDPGREDEPSEDAGEEASADAGEVSVEYEHSQRGHRVTRRTVRRREITEDTEETITDSYPVPHQTPAATGHPAPVG